MVVVGLLLSLFCPCLYPLYNPVDRISLGERICEG